MKSYNDELSQAFHEIADLSALVGDNIFKIRAYQNAARLFKETIPITKKTTAKELQKLPRIGPAISEKSVQFIKTGKIDVLQSLRKQIPKPVRDLLKIPHLGPGRVRALYINLGVKNKKDLLIAAKNGDMEELPRFGKKLVESVILAITKGQQKKKRHKRKDVEPIGKKIVKILKEIKGIGKVEIAGSYRRGATTVGDVDILTVGARHVVPIALKKLENLFPNMTVLAAGNTKISFVIFPENLQVDIRFVPKESWGAALLYFTGSKDYNVTMRRVAIEKGYLLNEYGLFDNGEYVAGKTEAEVFKKLGMKSVEPKKRK